MIPTKTCPGLRYLSIFFIILFSVHGLEPILDSPTTPKSSGTISPFGNVTLTNLPPMTTASSPGNHTQMNLNSEHPATLAPMPTAAKSNFTFGPMPTIVPIVNQTAPVLYPGNGTGTNATPIVLGDVTMPHAGNMSMVGMTTVADHGAPVAGITTTAGHGAPLAGETTTAGHGAPASGVTTAGHGAPAANIPGISTTAAHGAAAPEVTTTGHGTPVAGMTTTAGHGAPASNATMLAGLPTLGPISLFGATTTSGHEAPPAGMTTMGLPGMTTTAGHGAPAPEITTAGHGAPAAGMTTMGLPGMTTTAGHGALAANVPGVTTMGLPGMTNTAGHGAPPSANSTTLLGLPTLGPLLGATTTAGHGAPAAGMTTTSGHGAPPVANATMTSMNGTLAPGMTTTAGHGAPAATMIPGIPISLGSATTAGHGAPSASNATMTPMNGTTSGHGAPPVTMIPGIPISLGSATTTAGHGSANATMAPGMTTTAGHGAPAATTKGPTAPCGSSSCTSDQVCATQFNTTQVCTKRLSDRRYCIDNPCATGMKCFDNVTSQAYTCYTKLDGTAGECLGIQCSPGDICYQVMGQPAKCITLHQAPRCLGKNEEFSPCKSGCESTCAVPRPPCMNSTTCTSGCACIRGYARINGVCELMNKCPSTTTGSITCSGAEEYVACKPACEKTCSGVPSKACQLSLNSTVTTAPAVCTPGCSCRSAYKRDMDSGQCVQARQCFHTTTCGINESWSRCHNCEAVCGQTANPSCKTCWSGCGCNPGFSRSTSGVCVESSKCS
ncbi:hypothetical protein B9Z55_021798 [Caenorhabditis nigoni]|uniref:TIL domain-containing protein n=1 Tax=Caenorhabditis nigoni TaxID=1611254 RepID=A0A2G5TTH1_9PELO|nr:hypothetical protein B9Z55_021798 [Caenorhabditis nigoni]